MATQQENYNPMIHIEEGDKEKFSSFVKTLESEENTVRISN